jgi:hypothetical protein
VTAIEKGGIVFITQEAPISEGPLPDLPDLLPSDYVLFNTLEFDDRANWKLIGETSMEGYHIRALHGQSFYPYGYDNLNVVELHGCNSRIVSSIAALAATAKPAAAPPMSVASISKVIGSVPIGVITEI